MAEIMCSTLQLHSRFSQSGHQLTNQFLFMLALPANTRNHISRSNTFLFIFACAMLGTSVDGLAQSARDMKVEERQAHLENLHKQLYELPLSQNLIYQELMPKVREERKAIAPHFPQRGRTEEETQTNLASWLKDYPDELDAYSKFIEKKIKQYSNSNSRK